MSKLKLNQPDVETTTTLNSKECLEKFKKLYEDKYKLNPDRNLIGFDMCYITIKQDLNKLEKLTKTPTLEEVIKEWEEKGFIVNNQFKNYQYITISSKYSDIEDIFIYICLSWVNELHYSLEGHLNIKLNELLTKTLKALEVENDKNIN